MQSLGQYPKDARLAIHSVVSFPFYLFGLPILAENDEAYPKTRAFLFHNARKF